MKPITEIRRERLRQLVREQGAQVTVAARLGKDKNQIYQWLVAPGKKGYRNISEDSARMIERAFGKPAFWMDMDPSHSATLLKGDHDPWPSPSARLDPGMIDAAVTMVRAMLGREAEIKAPFDPHGDVPLFIAAYNLMAERTQESRARFDEAMAARAAANRGKNGEQRDTNPTGDVRGN